MRALAPSLALAFISAVSLSLSLARSFFSPAYTPPRRGFAGRPMPRRGLLLLLACACWGARAGGDDECLRVADAAHLRLVLQEHARWVRETPACARGRACGDERAATDGAPGARQAPGALSEYLGCRRSAGCGSAPRPVPARQRSLPFQVRTGPRAGRMCGPRLATPPGLSPCRRWRAPDPHARCVCPAVTGPQSRAQRSSL